MLTKEQLSQRRTGVGGSDTAAVLGLSKWKTAFEVYCDKVMDTEREQVTDGPMYFGTVLEPFVRSEYERRTKQRVIVPQDTLRHPKYPWLIANVDGLVADADCGWEGKVIGAAPDSEWGEEGTDQVPVDYLIQCQHYMLVTGLSSWDLTALIGNREVRTYTINASKPMHNAIIERTREFWKNHVEPQVPPLFSGASEVRALFTRAQPESPVQADDDVLVALNALAAVRAEQRSLASEEDRLMGVVMAYMREHDALMMGDIPVATWKERKAKSIDLTRLREKYPAIAQELTVQKSSRVFLLKTLRGDSNE